METLRENQWDQYPSKTDQEQKLENINYLYQKWKYINTDPTEIKIIMKKCYDHFYPNKFDNLEKMNN